MGLFNWETMRLRVTTQKGAVLTIEYRNDSRYYIVDSNQKYLRDEIMLKPCRRPREFLPLEIFNRADETLVTSRIEKIEKLIS